MGEKVKSFFSRIYIVLMMLMGEGLSNFFFILSSAFISLGIYQEMVDRVAGDFMNYGLISFMLGLLFKVGWEYSKIESEEWIKEKVKT